jgi:hypothetical protein
MNLDFNGTQPVLVYGLHSQLVVTTALILTFSPGEKGQRLHMSLYAAVRPANPVAGGLTFRGSRREFVGGNLSPRLAGRGSQTNCATTGMGLILPICLVLLFLNRSKPV